VPPRLKPRHSMTSLRRHRNHPDKAKMWSAAKTPA